MLCRSAVLALFLAKVSAQSGNTCRYAYVHPRAVSAGRGPSPALPPPRSQGLFWALRRYDRECDEQSGLCPVGTDDADCCPAHSHSVSITSCSCDSGYETNSASDGCVRTSSSSSRRRSRAPPPPPPTSSRRRSSSYSSSTSCASICTASSCGSDCPICRGTGAGHPGNGCSGCGSSVSCSGGGSSYSSSYSSYAGEREEQDLWNGLEDASGILFLLYILFALLIAFFPCIVFCCAHQQCITERKAKGETPTCCAWAVCTIIFILTVSTPAQRLQ